MGVIGLATDLVTHVPGEGVEAALEALPGLLAAVEVLEMTVQELGWSLG